METCKKNKRAYFKENLIYADAEKTIEIPDATSDYDSLTAEANGFIFLDENNTPIFLQSDLNKDIKDALNILINAFSITTLPSSAWEIELDQKLKDAKIELENILEKIP